MIADSPAPSGRLRTRLGSGFAAFLILLLSAGLLPSLAHAQLWSQKAEIIVPNRPDGIVRAFVDSLGVTLDRNPEAVVRQIPGSERLPYRDLSQRLLAEGVDVRSASHLFVRYTFAHGQVGVEERIESVTLIYRPLVLDEPDLPLVHLSASNPHLQQLLARSGMRHVENLGAITPFRNGLAYPQLSQTDEARMVRYAGQPLRSGFDTRMEHLLARLTEFVYNDGEPFVLRVE